MGQLTDVQIRNWIKAGVAVAKSDGDGLTFTLSAKGTAAWVLRYRASGAKSQKEVTLGRYPDISLGKARELATEARAKVQQGPLPRFFATPAPLHPSARLRPSRLWREGFLPAPPRPGGFRLGGYCIKA